MQGLQHATLEQYWQETTTYLGSNREYYMSRWAGRPSGSLLAGFNAAALFFAPCWLFYRKLYGWGTLYYLIVIAIGSAMYAAPPGPAAALSALYPLLHLCCALLGNGLYRRKVMREVGRASAKNLADKELTLRSRGGVSVFALALAVVLQGIMAVGLGLLAQLAA